jgi:hypothetical protein
MASMITTPNHRGSSLRRAVGIATLRNPSRPALSASLILVGRRSIFGLALVSLPLHEALAFQVWSWAARGSAAAILGPPRGPADVTHIIWGTANIDATYRCVSEDRYPKFFVLRKALQARYG